MFDQNATAPEIFSFFQRTPDLVCIAGKDGFFRNVNNAVVETLGFTREELFSHPIAFFIHPDDKDLTSRRREELLAGKALMDFENRYLKKNGGYVWLHWTSIYFPDKEIVFAIAKDITDRKQKEIEIEQKYKRVESIARHFKTTLEKEKKSLATELHEELAQIAAVAKTDIEGLRENIVPGNTAALKKIDHAAGLLDVLINSIRKISYSISPNMIDDLGLNETLKTLAEEFTMINGIPCFFESKVEDEALSEEISVDLFRICQESLSNVSRHARANSVYIKLEPVNDKLCLSIVDDGVGFHYEQLEYLPGIADMRERAASVNAELVIESEPGKGTSVQVSLGHQPGDNE